MRLENYILNEGRGKGISKDVAIELLLKNCKQAIKAYNDGYEIFRGVNHNKDYVYIDPKKGIRRSTSGIPNYYTYIMTNEKEWKAYPKRNRSLICVTERLSAECYGDTYIVFPYDGAKIGICPETDIWKSFKNVDSVNIFLRVVRHVFDCVHDSHGDYDKSFKSFKDACKKVDNTYSDDLNEVNRYFMSYKYFEYTGNFYKDLCKVFSPDGFKLAKIGDNLGAYHEVWTDSESIMVSEKAINDIYGRVL